MNVFVLTTEDGGDNELFCGCVSTLEGVDLKKYTFYKVEVDGPFDHERVPGVGSQVPDDGNACPCCGAHNSHVTQRCHREKHK